MTTTKLISLTTVPVRGDIVRARDGGLFQVVKVREIMCDRRSINEGRGLDVGALHIKCVAVGEPINGCVGFTLAGFTPRAALAQLFAV